MKLTAPFNNMQSSELKAQPTNAFFTTVNQMISGFSQLLSTAKHCSVVGMLNYMITTHSLSSSQKLGRAIEHFVEGRKKHICRLSFEFWSPHVIEKYSQ